MTFLANPDGGTSVSRRDWRVGVLGESGGTNLIAEGVSSTLGVHGTRSLRPENLWVAFLGDPIAARSAEAFG